MSHTIHTHLSCPRCYHKDCFAIYSSGAHCFSCKHTVRGKHRDLFLEKELEVVNTKKLNVADMPMKTSLSIESLLFLEKRGINSYLRFIYSIYEGIVYNHLAKNRERRIILPFWCDGGILGYQARALDGQTPKYLSKLFYNNKGKIFYSKNEKTDTIVIVEDILSAIRIGKFTSSVALLGTSLDYEGFQLDKIRSFGPRNFIIWLDGDDAGTRSAVKLKKQLLLYGNVNIIYTREDPKNLSDRQLKETLSLSGCFQRKDIRTKMEFRPMAITL